MLIRAAEASDLEKIADLYVHNHRKTYKGLLADSYLDSLSQADAREKWARCLQNPGNRIWVACEGECFLGFAAGTADKELPNTWLLDSLHVAEDARGKGTGTALIRVNALYAAENGFSRMSVCLVRGNEKARSLYRKLGAEHDSFFEDSFGPSVSRSEKLVWAHLPLSP
ncbi:MAG: GNAT family N-acetyltransferase [Oscillospiraceae bacterium]|nr:GNAT family N-acetyltransferase [Oscillospiraceae bacterium]